MERVVVRVADPVVVRMFGLLRDLRIERGEPTCTEVSVAEEGTVASEVAAGLGLPLDRIEAVFCNHSARGLDHVVMPGDRVAFVPHGTPGPWRMLLGIRSAGEGCAPGE